MLAANLSFAIAGPNGDQAVAVRTDAAGNVYELATDAVYKFNAAGAQVWSTAYTAGGALDTKEGLALDSGGNIYIAGMFNNDSSTPAQFGTTSLVSAGGNDGFLAKLDSNGNFLWATSFGGTGDDDAYAVATDSSGDVYLTGAFSGTATLGSGADSKTLTASGGFTDIVAAKFDPSGRLLWANGYGNTDPDAGRGIAVDGQGNAYVTGMFQSTVDFDPAQPGLHKFTSFFYTAFILKLDTNGGYVWSKELNAENSPLKGRAVGEAISLDSAGNIYTTGLFGGSVELNPNGGPNTTADFVFPDAYVLKLDSSGAYDWAADLHDVSVTNPFGGLQPNDIATDAQGNVYSVGWYDGVANFNPQGQYLTTSAGGDDVYISELDSQGKFVSATTAGASGTDQGYGIAVTSAVGGEYVYAVGTFSKTVDFNSGYGSPDNVTANGVWDGFLWGLNSFRNSIAGVVWDDQDGDSLRESAEPGVPSVDVALFAGSPGSGTQVATTTTDALGLYSFQGVGVGQSYYVQVAGTAFAVRNAGPDPTLDSNVSATTGQSAAIVLSAGQSVMVNAGLPQAAPPLTVNMAFGFTTVGFTEGSSIVADSSGDIYVAGSFDGNTTFGSGAGTVTLKTGANNDFVAKYSTTGTLVWVRQIVSDFWEYDPKIKLDASGNLYLAASLTGDATVGSIALTAAGTGTTSFLVKFDKTGKALWAKTSVVSGTTDAVGMAVDSAGNAYLAGGFKSTVTVNTTPVTKLISDGGNDAYIVKYSPSGTALWAKNYGGTKDDSVDSVAIDPQGNPVVTGSFESTAQFGGTTLASGSGSWNDFVAKLSATDGSVVWAEALTSTSTSGTLVGGAIAPTSRIAVDSAGNVYSTGRFEGTIQLDPTNATDAIKGTNASFISKLDANGIFVWGKAFSAGTNGYDVEGYGIALDSTGDVYTTGSFAATENFNPNGAPAHNLTAIGASYDIYLSQLDSQGNYVNALQFGGSGEDEGTAIFVDANKNVYATGVSYGPSTFGSKTVGATNDKDIFVVRLANTFGSLVNVAPSFAIQGPLQAVALNAPPQTVPGFVGKIVPGLPGEVNEIATFTVTTDNNALFAVPPQIDESGTLTYTPAAGAVGTANVTVVLRNDGGTANKGSDTSPPQTFPITIDVNHAPSFTEGANQTFNENTGEHTASAWATNISPGPPSEAGQTVKFLVSADNFGLFLIQPAIDPVTGDLTYTQAPDEFGTANVTVRLQDNGGTANNGVDTSAPQTFTIKVNLVNHAPSFTEGADQATNENSGPQVVSAWATSVTAGPPSESAQKLNFIITTDNNALFAVKPSIDPLTGNLTYTPALDVSGVAHVTVQLHDDGGVANGGADTSAPQTFTITVNYVNQPPTFTVGPNLEVLENSVAQRAANWATGIGPGAAQEAGQALNFIVTTDNDALFAVAPTIDPTTGTLSFTPATNAFGVANVTVQLHDDNGTANGGIDTSPPQTFTITVDLINHAPSFTAGANQVVNENAGDQTIAGWATSVSAGPASEAGQALNFVITTDNDALFASPPQIDPATGDLTYTPATDQSGVATVTVALEDNGGTNFGGVDTSVAQSFIITVNFVNQPPTFSSAGDQTIHETPGPQTVAAWATNISAGAATEADQQLNFLLSTDNNSLFSSLPTINAATGNLTYTPAVYALGVAHVTVKLHDDGGLANGGIDTSSPQVFTITVTQSNQAPTFTPGADQILRGSFGQQAVAGWAANIRPGPPNEAGQAVQFLDSTDNDALFSVLPAVDSSTGNLTYTPVPGASGQAHVTLRLKDNGGLANGGVDTSAPVTFLISITYVNQAPSFTRGPDDAVDENSGPESLPGWAKNIIAGPPNELAQSLNFVATTDNDALFAVPPSIDPVTGDLTYTPATNANGVAHVTVILHDDGGVVNGGQDTSVAQTFTVTVNPVNQAPFFTGGPNLLLRENEGVRTFSPWATGISPGAANEVSQALNFSVSTDDDALFASLPSIDPATGSVTFTTAQDATGVANVTIQLHDGGGTARGGQDTSSPYTFTVTVTPANQPPSFIAGGDQTAKESAGVQTAPGWATNINPGAPIEAGQVLRFIVSTDNPGLFAAIPTIDATTGELTYAPAPDASGVAHLTVQLYDDGGILNGGADISPPQNFTIAVSYVNDAPSFAISGDPPAVNENGGPQAVANFATSISPSGNSPPEANEAKQAVHFNVTGISITAGSATPATFFTTPPTIDVNGTLTYQVAPEISGSAQVTVDLQDNGGTATGGRDTSLAQSFTITAAFINEAPRFTHHGSDQVVAEDSGTTSVAGWATSAPGNGTSEANQHVNYQLTTANPALFTAAGQPAIDASGTLTFTPAPQVTGTTTVTVIAKDDGGTANGGIDQSPPIKFHIEIDPANHAPTVIKAIAPVVVNEGAADQIFSLAGVFDDLDVDLATGDHLTLSLAGDSNAKLVTATLTSADTATGNLILHFAPNQVGTATIDLVVTDQSQASVDDPIVITINSIPTFTAGPDQHVPLGSGPIRAPAWATAILAASANETGQSLIFQTTVTSTTNPALFAVAPAIDASGNLTFTPASGQLGQATVAVTLHDSSAAAGSDDSVPHTFTIEVVGAPVAQDHTFVVSTSASNSVAANVGAVVGDTDSSGLPLTARLVSAPTNGSVQFNADGSFTYTKGATFAGLDSFSYQLSDGLAASNVATVNIISYEATIVTKLYQQVLNRAPDTQGLEHWVGLIQQGQPYSVIAQGIFESDERLDPIIEGDYQQFLQRSADAAGLVYWAGVWRGFGGPEPVVAGLIGSPEFYASAGQAKPSLSPNAAWVTALYERLLNREPDQDGLQYWSNQLDGGTQDRLGVINGFENSVEHFQNVTIALYQQYLNRQPTADELSNNVAAFAAGATQRTIQIKLIDSTEYRNSPPPPATGSADRLS
jgi:hypothetical protein